MIGEKAVAGSADSRFSESLRLFPPPLLRPTTIGMTASATAGSKKTRTLRVRVGRCN